MAPAVLTASGRQCGATNSKQIIAAIDQLSVDQASFIEEFVRSRWTFGIDVKYLVSVRNHPVRYDHAMATKINSLGTHVRGR
jgi:hypothetical protein